MSIILKNKNRITKSIWKKKKKSWKFTGCMLPTPGLDNL